MKMLMTLIGFAAVATAAPQFDSNENQPTPYSFSYGVNSPDTGDEKEHKETVSSSGITEGEFRWLQPNGLYRTTRYTVDDVSGFRAIVSEEPGERVANYYTNSLLGGSVQTPFIDQGSQPTSTSIQSGNRGIATPQNVQIQQPSIVQSLPVSQVQIFTPQTVQTQNQAINNPSQTSFNLPQNTQSQGFTTFTNDGNIIDGGIIDGGIIDGGIIGSTSSTLVSGTNSFSSSPNTFNNGGTLSNTRIISNRPNLGLAFSRPGNSQVPSNNNQGVAVILAGNQNQFRG